MAEDVFGIVGTVLGGAYHVEAVVAEGGFGVVYRAHHSGFRAHVALKCLKVPQQLTSDQEAQFLEQFRAEAELLFRLSASIPTVVRPLHVDAITMPDGRFVPFMALEWLEGETLDSIAERRKAEGLPPIPLKKLVRMLTPVARALERAHNFMGPSGPISVVHRDLKPENIFVANVAGEEVVKILDFGIGKAKSVASQVAGRASQTQSAFTSFTPAYGAPEQWVPKRYGQTGPWTDVWGLALTMVEIMAGRTVIDGDQAGMMGTVLDPKRRPTPQNEGLDVSDAVEAVFRRALAVDPRERYPEAGAFWADLVQTLGMRGEGSDIMAPRDQRAEVGMVPRLETIEAARHGGRRRIASGAHARMGNAVPAQAAVAAGVYPEPLAPPGPPGPPPHVPDLAIPDLGVPAGMPKTKSDGAPRYSREFDFDDTPSATGGSSLEVDLDLPPGERPSLRQPTSRPDWSIPEPPAPPPPETARARVASGANPMVLNNNPPPPSQNATASGAWPAERVSNPPSTRVASVRPLSEASSTLSRAAITSRPPPPPPAFEEPPSLIRRLAPGALLVLFSIVITIADQMYASSTGEVFTLGPLRSGWLSGGFMVAGVILIAIRLIPAQRP
jgi:eukaryotic-like serine/threonine-protein kinase